MNKKSKLYFALIALGITCFLMCLTAMLINVALHYIVLLIGSLPAVIRAVKSNTNVSPMFSFKSSYLFAPVPRFPWYLPWLFATLLVMLRGRKLVWRVSDHILRRLPGQEPDLEGSQRWATNKEIKRYLQPVPKSGIAHAKVAGILLAESEFFYFVDKQAVNTLIIGTTRSGKDMLIILNTIRLASQSHNQESFLVFDLKGEDLENCYMFLHSNGYAVDVVNLADPKRSSKRDLLFTIKKKYLEEAKSGDEDYSGSIELVKELAQILTDNPQSDPVWPNSARALLTAIIIYMLEDGYKRGQLELVNMYSVLNFFLEYGSATIRIGKQKVNALDNLFAQLPVGHPAKLAYAPSNFADGEMRSSIFSTLATNLDIFADTGIARLTSGNDVDFAELANPDKPHALFIIVPEGRTTRYPLAALMMAQAYSELVEIARRCPGKRLKRRVRNICNEFGNMPQITGFSTKITTALGHNMMFDLYVQSLSQLEERYGRLNAMAIQGNCGNWVYLNSMDVNTNKYVSQLLGNGTKEYKTYNSETGDLVDQHRMSHYKSRPLKMPEELPRMPFGDMVVVRQRCYPIFSQITPFYAYKLPITPIEQITLPENKAPLRDLLYPFKPVTAPKEDATPLPSDDNVPPAAADANGGHKVISIDSKLQSVLNNIDILTHGKFGHAVEKRNVNALYTIISKYQESGQLNMEQAELLEVYVDNLSDSKE
ncbi:VirD4-like conjugal transfer protein, CD1115 family [Ethanoligenens sp.]|uniref:VirD4-like conjugal transfer protein, CD1115 family n=1 Tax=Ethanoligenens sp. TaxID=2099655 RepID=UPI0039EC617A